MNNWKTIWNKRGIVSSQFSGNEYERFCELKKANGFDVAVENAGRYYRTFYDSWLTFFERVTNLIGQDINSVFEVGCGSGVNLFMFKNRLPEAEFDIVMSESVFQYFESQEYAETVLRKMIEKANKLTYLGEIHNKKYEDELIQHRRKTIENYDEKYKGLNKLFLHKEWITDIAKDYGKKVIFTEVDTPEYLNGKYEYNAYIF